MENMIRGIIGDIVGSIYEGKQWTKKEQNLISVNAECISVIKSEIEIRDSQTITDDSICTIGLYHAYKKGLRGKDAARELSDYCKQHYHVGFGKSFQNWIDNPEPYGSYANGCLMRLGFLEYVPIEERLEIALNYTNISHNSELPQSEDCRV